MTTSISAPAPTPTATAYSPAPATRLRRRAAGVAAVAGGVLTFAGFAATPWEGSNDTALYLQALADHPVQAQVAATLLHFGFMLMVPAVLALGQLVRRRAVVLGHIGLFLGLLGTIGLPGLLVVDWYGLELAQSLPIDQAVAIEEATQEHPLAALLAAPSALGMVAGFVLLLVAAARAGKLTWWLVPVLPAGFLMSMQPTLLGGLVAGGSMMLVMVAVGVRTLRATDAEWETGA
jgi:hypothetical protein